MLELICDFRTGEKLEIIIPVLNEHVRLNSFVKYYSDSFDIVVLDGGSNEKTIEWMRENKITIFNRTLDAPTEKHFVLYANELTKSGRSFYLMADEYVEKALLIHADKFLTEHENGVIFCKKYEWAYGFCSNPSSKQKTFIPRGFTKGQALYNSEYLHSSLKNKALNNNQTNHECELHHFHLWEIQSAFGKAGLYAGIEVKEFFGRKNGFRRFFKRFIFNELVLLPFNMWKARKRGLIFLVWMLFMSVSITSIGILCLIEYKCFPGIDKQREIYNRFFQKNSDMNL